MKSPHVLLIEDDDEISRLTTMYLDVEGFKVSSVKDGALAIEAIKEHQPDLIVLDLMLPNMSGIEICKQAREFYQKPILVLTACDDDVSEVSLLKIGADDYLVKPLRPHVLVARIEALMRRSQKVEPVEDKKLVINEFKNQVMFKGKPLELTGAEYEMLKLLNQHAGKVITREKCCQLLRGIDYDCSNRSIDMRISGLRRKLEGDQLPYQMIVTIRNQGYKLVND